MLRTFFAFNFCSLLLFAHGAFGASFDCAKAATRIEKQICADPHLSELDDYLDRYYHAAQQRLDRAGECLRKDQRRWLRETRNVCESVDCLKDAYGSRLRELERFQPGATSIEHIELPPGPTLAWIFAPAEDELALPSGSSAAVTIEGVYVDEPLHGPSVRASDGVYVIVPTMLFEGQSHGVLERLQASEARVLVRGHLMDEKPNAADYEDPEQTPQGFFDNRECVYLYVSE